MPTAVSHMMVGMSVPGTGVTALNWKVFFLNKLINSIQHLALFVLFFCRPCLCIHVYVCIFTFQQLRLLLEKHSLSLSLSASGACRGVLLHCNCAHVSDQLSMALCLLGVILCHENLGPVWESLLYGCFVSSEDLLLCGEPEKCQTKSDYVCLTSILLAHFKFSRFFFC